MISFMVTFGRLDIFLLNFFFNRYIFGLILQQENLIVFEKAQSFMNFIKFPFRIEINPNYKFVVLFCQILILEYPYETLCSQLSGVLLAQLRNGKKTYRISANTCCKNYSFSKFSCIFLNPNNFFQFEF